MMNLSALERVSNRDHIIPADAKGKGLEKLGPGIQERREFGSAIPRLWQIGRETIPLPPAYSAVDSAGFAANISFGKRAFLARQTARSHRPLAGASENPSRSDGFPRLFVSNSIPQRFATRNCWPHGPCRLTFCQEVRNDALRF